MDTFFLTSSRLGFRSWTPADLPLALELWGDARVTRLVGGPFTPQQVEQRLAQEIATQQAHGIQYWPIFRRADGEHVGCCGLRLYREETDVLEVGCHLRCEHWGQGYAAESTRAVIAYAFNHRQARALFAGHHPNNHDSQRLLQRLGFRHVGAEHYPPTGLEHPSYLLARDVATWT